MNNKPEHTADISAELRTLSRGAKLYGLQPTVYGKPISIYFAELADRIDVASVGNCAAIRDALVAVKKLFDGRLMFQPAIRTAHEAVNAALAAPPRNCDMFGGDAKMLHTAWFDWTRSPSGHNADGTVKLTYGEWLLVLASKKGGAQ